MRRIDLWQYLPPYLKRYRELRALLAAEEPEFQGYAEAIGHGMDDLFILTAGESAIRRYEKIAGIHPLPGESLEERRNRVLSVWYTLTPYNLATLLRAMALLQGDDDVAVVFDTDEDPYFVVVETRMSRLGQLLALRRLLMEMTPANLVFDMKSRVEPAAAEGFAMTRAVGAGGAVVAAMARRDLGFASTGRVTGYALPAVAGIYVEGRAFGPTRPEDSGEAATAWP